jgi:hypothetical protein
LRTGLRMLSRLPGIDAEVGITTTEHALGLAASLVIRHIRSVPEQCPNCGSRHLSPEEGWLEDLPEIAWERPICSDCGWAGTPVAVGDRAPDAEGEKLIVRVGGSDTNDCGLVVLAESAAHRVARK